MARFEQSQDFAAIEHGVADADVFFRMGMMYATGRSVETDLVAAHTWFNLAAAQGHDRAAGFRHEVSQEMSSDEIAEAQRAAREWVRTYH